MTVSVCFSKPLSFRFNSAFSKVNPISSGITKSPLLGMVVVEEAGGVAKSFTGKSACAASITSFRIRAGKVPPYTLRSVRGGTIGICPFGYPTHTAVAICGV